MSYAKVVDNPSLVRDMESQAILNVNQKEILEFNAKRKKILEEKADKEETKMRLAKIEQEMNDIKMLLKEIAQIRSENAHQ
jgi:hypothetical protein